MLYRQLQVKDLPKVPTWRLEWGSNLRSCRCKAPNLPLSHHLLPNYQSRDTFSTSTSDFELLEGTSVIVDDGLELGRFQAEEEVLRMQRTLPPWHLNTVATQIHLWKPKCKTGPDIRAVNPCKCHTHRALNA